MKKFDPIDSIMRLLPMAVLAFSALWFIADLDKRLSIDESNLTSLKEQMTLVRSFNASHSSQLKDLLVNQIDQMQEEIDAINAENWTPTHH